ASQNSAPDSNVSATREIVQHITLESTSDAYLPTLSEPVRFEMPTGLSAPQSDDTNCWQIPRVPSVTTRTYTVVSEVPDPTSEQLRKASQDYSDISRISPPCVEQPIVSERVIAKALEETRRYKNPYDKVTALHRYLARTCVYDLQTPPIPASKSDDPVDYFLWTSRRGYCDLFATALATMTRSLGIPARVATGYIQGEYDLAERKWVVRDKDRHMWAEVYFPGYGWIPFEATPSSGAEEQGYWQAVWTELKLAFTKGNPRILFLLAALMLGIFSLRYVILSDAGKLHNTIIVHEREELKRARHIWKKLARMLRAHGVAAPPSATPIELSDVAALVLADAPAARHAVHRAALLISEILYSGDDPGESIEKLESAARVARIELKLAKPRIRFLITDRREN
ncbi:MAG: transglutaminase domain-containing protein, partial [Armatimonadota bacterium]